MFIYVRLRHSVFWKKFTNQTEYSLHSIVTGTIFDNNYNKAIFYSKCMVEGFNNGIYTCTVRIKTHNIILSTFQGLIS